MRVNEAGACVLYCAVRRENRLAVRREKRREEGRKRKRRRERKGEGRDFGLEDEGRENRGGTDLMNLFIIVGDQSFEQGGFGRISGID